MLTAGRGSPIGAVAVGAFVIHAVFLVGFLTLFLDGFIPKSAYQFTSRAVLQIVAARVLIILIENAPARAVMILALDIPTGH